MEDIKMTNSNPQKLSSEELRKDLAKLSRECGLKMSYADGSKFITLIQSYASQREIEGRIDEEEGVQDALFRGLDIFRFSRKRLAELKQQQPKLTQKEDI